MGEEENLFKADIPLYKKILLFPVWLISNIFTVLLTIVLLLAVLGIILEIGESIFA